MIFTSVQIIQTASQVFTEILTLHNRHYTHQRPEIQSKGSWNWHESNSFLNLVKFHCKTYRQTIKRKVNTNLLLFFFSLFPFAPGWPRTHYLCSSWTYRCPPAPTSTTIKVWLPHPALVYSSVSIIQVKGKQFQQTEVSLRKQEPLLTHLPQALCLS